MYLVRDDDHRRVFASVRIQTERADAAGHDEANIAVAKIVFAAVFPKGCMANRVKRYRAPLVSVRIKVVITDEGRNVVRCRILRREQKRSALAAAPTPLFQLKDETTPRQDRNRYLLPGLGALVLIIGAVVAVVLMSSNGSSKPAGTPFAASLTSKR